jgi:enterochelin esterase-like enzyme
MSSSLERFTIASRRSLPRGITVYVPATRAPADRPLPLLVLHDGQNLFDPDRAHIRGRPWQVAETVDRMIEAGRLAPLLIAGVDHGLEARIAELTPTRGQRPAAGGVAEYGRFVMDDLVPYLARTLRARTDAAGLAVGGSSLGGLATLAIARQFPGRIGRLLVMSPSVWWDDRVIIRRLRRVGFHGRPRVWLDIGRREGARAVTDARALRDVLVWQTAALRYTEDPAGDHSEGAWARTLPEALEWLYAGPAGPAGSVGS